jgi:hypothetical protein
MKFKAGDKVRRSTDHTRTMVIESVLKDKNGVEYSYLVRRTFDFDYDGLREHVLITKFNEYMYELDTFSKGDRIVHKDWSDGTVYTIEAIADDGGAMLMSWHSKTEPGTKNYSYENAKQFKNYNVKKGT